jgi:hypothetical protein
MSNLIRLSEASKKYDVPYQTILSAIKRGRLESVKEGKASYVDEDDFEKWVRRKAKKAKGKYKIPQKVKQSQSSNGHSNTSIFITLLMKIVAELSKIEPGLSGPALTAVQQVKKEIMSTMQGIKL